MALLGDSKIVSLTLLDGVIGDLNPKTTNVYDLGTSSLKWRNIYGTFKGNADTATAANLTTTTNAIAKYSNTTGAFANSGVTIDSSNNISTNGDATVKRLYIFGNYADNKTNRYFASGGTNDIYASITGVTSLVITNAEIRRGANASTINLGTQTYPWNNIYGNNIYGNGSNLTSLNASNLSSGTLPDARLSTITRSDTTSTSDISLPNSFQTISYIGTDNYGRVTAVDTKTITLTDRIFPVNVTLTSLSTGTSDKTNTEIATAVSEGKIPFVSIIYGAAKMLAPLTFINSSEAVFTYENQADSDFTYATLTITNGNEASLIWQSKYFAQGSTYWGSELVTTSAKYNTNPEVASVIIGNGGNSNPSSKNVQLQYDDTLEVLNFVFT